MSAELGLRWFSCLFGNVQQTSRADGSASKATNRTVIVLTAKPQALLTLMNASEEDNIADAAEKAIKLLNTECEKIYSSMSMGDPRFVFICILGPIEDYRLAQEITHEWIKSRGGYPRTTYAQELAYRYGVGFTPNIEAIYALNNLSVDVTILESSTGGATLEIRPKKSL